MILSCFSVGWFIARLTIVGGGVEWGRWGVCVCVCVFLLQQNWSRCSFSTLIFASEALSCLNVSFNKCLSGFRGFLGGSGG